MISTPASKEPGLYRAVIEYDGTDFLGFQLQAEGRTVQGVLEQTLEQLTQQFVRVVGAGRTDAGVHAKGQVIAFRTDWRHGVEDLHRGLNALAPADVAVSSLDLAPSGFHPRFSATSRWYRYRIGLWPGHSPLGRRYAWEIGQHLDFEAMASATLHLVGSHDFASFGQAPDGESTTRHVIEAAWRQEMHPKREVLESGAVLLFNIRANAFLRHMVRNVVATLVMVGQGSLSPTDVVTILVRRERALSAPPAPPQGLCLMAVFYPGDDEIECEATGHVKTKGVKREA